MSEETIEVTQVELLDYLNGLFEINNIRYTYDLVNETTIAAIQVDINENFDNKRDGENTMQLIMMLTTIVIELGLMNIDLFNQSSSKHDRLHMTYMFMKAVKEVTEDRYASAVANIRKQLELVT